MKLLKTAYEEAKAKGLLTTDVIWFNCGFHYDHSQGKNVDDVKEIAYDDLEESTKHMMVSWNQWEKGAKFYWVENGQFCVGKDGNTCKLYSVKRKGE